MKALLFALISMCSFLPENAHKTIQVSYTITHKPEMDSIQALALSADPWLDSAMNAMISAARISYEFDLTSELTRTSISKYRSVGDTRTMANFGPYSFRDGQWFTTNLLDSVDMFEVDYVETTEQKDILGYRCTRFQCTSRGSGPKFTYQIWATKRLPSYVNPVVGLTNFPWGILESVQGDSSAVIRAQTIKQVEEKNGKKFTIEEI